MNKQITEEDKRQIRRDAIVRTLRHMRSIGMIHTSKAADRYLDECQFNQQNESDPQPK